MTNAQIQVPHVRTALLNILGELGVAKNGQLPSNMGGKPYITAADVAKEVKTLLVANELIAIPTERVVKHELINTSRINTAIVIEAQYTFLSTRDGSSITVQGVGDGLAGGTAVASNIASTNALKNALLRTFMITEQSVEDAAKNGAGEDPTPPAAVRAATKNAGGGTAKAVPSGTKVEELQQAVRTAWEDREGEGDSGYIAFGDKLTELATDKWVSDAKLLEAILKAIKGGEVL